MQADILDAVATYLGSELDVPVRYPEQPRSTIGEECIVVTPGGSVATEGDRGYAELARLRADLRCYGATDMRSMEIYRDVAELLKELTPRDVIVAGGAVIVRIHNATLTMGPILRPDPDTKESCVYATWGVHGHEMERFI